MIEDGTPLTFRRALRASEFWLLLVTSAGGAFGGAWWVFVPLCVVGLSISALPKYWGRLKVCALNNANSDRPRTRASQMKPLCEWAIRIMLSACAVRCTPR